MHAYLIRNAGKWVSKRVPIAEDFLKWIYGIFPSSFHDRPANFLKRYFANWEHVQFISDRPARPRCRESDSSERAFGNNAWSLVLVEPNPTLFEQLKLFLQ